MLSIAALISVASIIPAFLISFIFFGRNKTYTPFLLLIILAGSVELISYILSRYQANTIWLFNVLVYIQFFLLIWQLINFDFLKLQSVIVRAVFTIVSITWVVELVMKKNQELNNHTLALSGFFLVIFFIIYINRLIFERVRFILTDSRFLISAGVLIYFTTSMLIFVFRDSRFEPLYELSGSLWAIHNYINTFTNIIYTIALLCIPKK